LNFEHKLDSNYCQAKKYSGELYGVFAAKDLILPDPSKIKMVSYSAIRRTSVVDGESI